MRDVASVAGLPEAWRRAATFADLCQLTEQWLSGGISRQPGYFGPVDVDEQQAPGLTEALVALSRFGVLTRCSQAGADAPGFNGACWTQVAAVEGYAAETTVADLRARLAGTPYLITTFGRGQTSYDSMIPVTWQDGEVCTCFGGIVSADEILWDLDGVGPAAIGEVVARPGVLIVDPEVGRNTLWADLSGALQQ